MNSLLKRQIRKYLPKEFLSNPDLEPFLDAVNRSYDTSDEQFLMLQNAMSISSEELFTANQKLLKETEYQKKVIDKLQRIIERLKFYKLPNTDQVDQLELDGAKLVDYIDQQTKEIIQINQQREELLLNLETQNKELSDYAHMVSHDLKSPLRSIDALSTWMYDDYKDTLGTEGKQTLQLIRDNVGKMDVLVNGILEYSTIGKTEIDTAEISIQKIVEDIRQSIYNPKQIKINLIGDFPVIEGNAHRIKQLFQNLISNAIKYNDKADGFVEVGVQEQEAFWEFYVKDNGKGIEEKFYDKIFETFQKLENTVNSSGIGLSIVKKIVMLYQGEIWVDSQVGKGSTFYFTLKK